MPLGVNSVAEIVDASATVTYSLWSIFVAMTMAIAMSSVAGTPRADHGQVIS
jgi:hypothetical protein